MENSENIKNTNVSTDAPFEKGKEVTVHFLPSGSNLDLKIGDPEVTKNIGSDMHCSIMLTDKATTL